MVPLPAEWRIGDDWGEGGFLAGKMAVFAAATASPTDGAAQVSAKERCESKGRGGIFLRRSCFCSPEREGKAVGCRDLFV